MSSVLNERRDAEWKKTWTGNTLLSAPPLSLLAIVGIVVFLLWLSSYLNLNYKYTAMQMATTNLKMLLLFLPLVLTLMAQGGRLVVPASSVARFHDRDEESESSIYWGWVTFVVFLLVLISYRLHPIFVIAIVFLYVYILSA
ncbi:uncharacterized protein LOC113859969 [Abrus precatorius]|uniref:Uncharacterized protein LOC113859969 n=1 Tax=Abrus precatorius TaxID=3816 RepID=A0A8B8KWS4_ABRPR|nr:uncharacterized protein LOC113859969 [Abrus precatorius]